MKTDLKPCAQIGPKYSNQSAQLHSETDFLFSFYWFLTIQRLSVWANGNHWLGGWVGAWLAILHIFNSISVISGRWTGDNDWKGLERGLNPSIGQGLTYWATGAPRHWLHWADAQNDLVILRSNMLVFSNDAPHFRLVCIGRSIDWFESRLLEISDSEFINVFKTCHFFKIFNISDSGFQHPMLRQN